MYVLGLMTLKLGDIISLGFVYATTCDTMERLVAQGKPEGKRDRGRLAN